MDKELLRIAKEAGKILMKHHRKKIEIKSKSKDFFNPVSIADLESNEYISSSLQKLYPHISILSEENIPNEINFSSPLWIIDPLDGTNEFITGREQFSVIICLLKNSTPYLGIVYEPYTDILYFAKKCKGAFKERNNRVEKLQVSKISKIKEAKCIVRSSYVNKNKFDAFIDKLSVKEKVEQSSIGLRLCAIADKRGDFYINSVILASKWDTSAGQIILEEAGGKITDIKGNPLNYNQKNLAWESSFIASNKALHNSILEIIPPNAVSLMKPVTKT